MPMTKTWEVTVSPGDFISMQHAKIEIYAALPVNGTVVGDKTPNGDWIFVVPSDSQTQEEVERRLGYRSIRATVRLAA